MASTPEERIPRGPYRRWIEGTDFSLEANTPSAPQEGAYYVFQGGTIRFSSRDYSAAAAEYDSLCVAYWEELLTSADHSTRLMGARGLFRRDQSHASAKRILTSEGTDQDRRLIAQASQRARHAERAAAAAEAAAGKE
jgi:hypothetical protein